MLILFFAVPVLLYALFAFGVHWTGLLNSRHTPLVAAIVTALLTLVGFNRLAERPGPWRQDTQVAWYGVSSTSRDQPLVIGGARAGTTVGWPRGAFWPQLVVRSVGSRLALEISGGGAFIRSAGRYLNGTVFERSISHGNFTIELERDWWHRPKLRVRNVDGKDVTAKLIPVPVGSEEAVSVSQLVQKETVRLRAAQERELAERLDSWASDLYLLVTKKEARLLDGRKQSSAELEPGSKIEILWPRLVLEARVGFGELGSPEVVFLPPLRQSSPLPSSDQPNRNVATLKVGGRPLPGDKIFLLPLGDAVVDSSQNLVLENGRFREPVRPPELFPLAPKPKTALPRYEGITSTATVDLTPYRFLLATLDEVPQVRKLAWPISLALLSFLAALLLGLRRIPLLQAFAAAGIALSLWAILCLRLVLAYRYALDPGWLDRRAVQGVFLSLMALTLLPSLFLVTVHLWEVWHARSSEISWWESRATYSLLVYWPAAIWLEARTVHGLWLLLPERYGSNFWYWGFGTAAVYGILRLLVARHTYRPSRSQRLVAKIVEFFELLPKSRQLKARAMLWCVVWLVILAPLAWRSSDKLAQEVAVPLLLVYPAILMLLASRVEPSRTGERSSVLFPLVLTLILLFIPVLLMDPGGLVAIAAVLVPTSIVLLFANPRRWEPAIILGCLFVCVFLLYGFKIPFAFKYKYLENVGVRVLHFRWGTEWLQRSQLYSPVYAPDRPVSLAQNFANAEEHLWANRAMAFEGHWTGLGFGYAPTRISTIPHQTLQADSTYSFYIASENGAIGGVGLLILYLVPLAMAIFSARACFHLGKAMAVVIAAAFFLEALAHVYMNLEVMPFTGRNLPLLSVNSKSDIVRWALLFSVLAVCLLLREERPLVARIASNGSSSRYWACTAGILAVTVAGILVVPGNLLYLIWKQTRTDLRLSREFPVHDLSYLLDEAERILHQEPAPVTVDPKNMTLKLSDDWKSSNYSLLQLQIDRFNELPDSERNPWATLASGETFTDKLLRVRSLDDYDGLIADLRNADQSYRSSKIPPLFRIEPPEEFADYEGRIAAYNPQFKVAVNTAYNRSLSFRTAMTPDSLPTLAFKREALGAYVINGSGYYFSLPDAPAGFQPADTVWLRETATGGLELNGEPRRDRSKVVVKIKCHDASSGKLETAELGQFEVSETGLEFRATNLRMKLRRKGMTEFSDIRQKTRFNVQVGDTLGAAQRFCQNQRPVVEIRYSAQNALIGPAWIMGSLRMASEETPDLPWITLLRDALAAQKSRLGGAILGRRLSLDRSLQRLAQEFVQVQGREHYQHLIDMVNASGMPQSDSAAAHQLLQMKLPPRLGLVVLNLPSGEILAMGGWPRSAPGTKWMQDGVDWRPPLRWLEHSAPRLLGRRYEGDRNFDLVVVGSATKPIWAAASLSVNPQLASALRVRGDGVNTSEESVFGIPIAQGHGWQTHYNDRFWCDLTCYLTRSDNRYQARLNFLGLVEPDAAYPIGIAVESPNSASDQESIDADGKPWHRYPRFPARIGFSYLNPKLITGLQSQRLAHALHDMFGIDTVRSSSSARCLSFWTGNEGDDGVGSQVLDSGHTSRVSSLFKAITPVATNLELDQVETPRNFVNLLLGGGMNMWSNVEFAGAFATSFTGTPVVPHILESAISTSRTPFPAVASSLRDGLRGVVTKQWTHTIPYEGTAYPYMDGTRDFVKRLGPGFEIFAKTGTLATGTETRNVSRIALAIIHRDKGQRFMDRGLVFSLYAERAELGKSSRLLNEFIVRNSDVLAALLLTHAAPTPSSHPPSRNRNAPSSRRRK